MKSKPSSQNFKKRMKELEKVSSRIKAKKVKLEKIVANISEILT